MLIGGRVEIDGTSRIGSGTAAGLVVEASPTLPLAHQTLSLTHTLSPSLSLFPSLFWQDPQKMDSNMKCFGEAETQPVKWAIFHKMAADGGLLGAR